ncbi:MAG: hypothetical protein GXY67_10580 [Clostridiales bacterium]|nr:hypothetical protein [Clostridiales bacterium]
MAFFEVTGFDEVLLEIEKENANFEQRAIRAVRAGGLVAANLLAEAAPERSGALKRSFVMSPPGKNFKDGIYVDVYPAGSQPNGRKKASNEEVGFVQEYGSSKQDAYPWMGPAIERGADAINAAMAAALPEEE